jgi:hypothetical protein
MIRIGGDADRPHARTLNVEVGIIDWVILFRTRSNLRKGLRVEDLPSTKGGTAYFTRAWTTIQAGDADA